MSEEELRHIVLEELGNVAPDADLSAVAGDADIREALDIDSMDFLNFVLALHHRLGIDVPERDYPQLRNVDSSVRYLLARSGTGGT